MSKYIIRRVLVAIPTFLGITILVFFISSLAPGGYLELMMGNQNISEAEIIREKAALGLDQPVIVQYFRWLLNLLKGNLGNSYRTSQPVLGMILGAIGPTLLLTFLSMLVACLIAIPLGSVSAQHQYRAVDNLISFFSFFSSSTPSFFTGLVFLFLFSVKLGWLPIGGMYNSGESPNFLSLLYHLIMPVLVLMLQLVGSLIQYVRSSMLEVMGEDYVRTGRAKGLSERLVIYRHVLRNALVPVVTYLGLSIPLLVGGAVITEQIFEWPGIGNLMLQSINSRDYPTIMGITVIVAAAVLIGNIVTDIVYGFLDPRIRYN